MAAVAPSSYKMKLTPATKQGDILVETNGAQVIVDSKKRPHLRGTHLDYIYIYIYIYICARACLLLTAFGAAKYGSRTEREDDRVMDPKEALKLAQGAGDCGNFSMPNPKLDPDFWKYKYELSKKKKESAKKSTTSKLKEVKFRVPQANTTTRPNCVSRAILAHGHKVKLTVTL